MDSFSNLPFSHDPSATAVFKALEPLDVPLDGDGELKAVVIGGGTGASMSIRTLLSMGLSTSAVVAMADDGGSTGILRSQAGATAPGDVRKCLTAMAADVDDPLVQAFKVRFGFAENHSLGNLMLSALESTSGSFPRAIQICEQLLHARGHVYPSTLDRVSLVAQTADGRTLEGQALASHSRSALKKVALKSINPQYEITAYQPAMEAISQADLILLGPGSLFTSIVPNLLVPGIIDAMRHSNSIVVFVCAIADAQGETRGLRVLEHYEALLNHGLEELIDYIFIQEAIQDFADSNLSMMHILSASDQEISALEKYGLHVVVRNFIGNEYLAWHDPAKLRDAIIEVVRACRLTQM